LKLDIRKQHLEKNVTITAAGIYLAELIGLRQLAHLDRPKVRFAPEDVPGAFCLWHTASNTSRDEIRLYPDRSESLGTTLGAVAASSVRGRSGLIAVRYTVSQSELPTEQALRELGATPNSPGFLMARTLGDLDESAPPPILDGSKFVTQVADTPRMYRDIRLLAQEIYGGSTANYDQEADFYSAPDILTYVAVLENDSVIASASTLVIGELANIWSVATRVDARGRGAGSLATFAACIEARRLGARAAVLGTSESLARKDGIYSRLGFTVVGHQQSWNLDAIDQLSHLDVS
jgi:GNAT superfamily N-acetyltransferase